MRIILDPPILAVIFPGFHERFQDFNGDFRISRKISVSGGPLDQGSRISAAPVDLFPSLANGTAERLTLHKIELDVCGVFTALLLFWNVFWRC